MSFAVITVLFAFAYKVLPDAKISWRDLWIGAAVTALLFVIGKYLIALYLGRSSTSSAFGAAGSLVVLLIWVFYSAQIFLMGAEFTQVYANRYGHRIKPEAHAEAVTEQGEDARGGAGTEKTPGRPSGEPAQEREPEGRRGTGRGKGPRRASTA